MNSFLDIRREVAGALAARRPVVALESTVIAHGLPRPRNLEAAQRVERAVREAGAVPATIGLLNGRVVAGLSPQEIDLLASAPSVAKVSRRDLACALAARVPGATTVAASIFAAAQAGIRVFATGGIGGVHRDALETFDISNDLAELAHTPIAVICSGAKVILDLPRTLEMLETLGVAVVGYGTQEFPAFYARASGLALQWRVDSPEGAARLAIIQCGLGLAAVVFCVPPPAEAALPRSEVEAWVNDALDAAEKRGIKGKVVTPYLLDVLAKASDGRTIETNVALLINNARVAAEIAVALSNAEQHLG